MEQFIIEGGHPLRGEVTPGGNKNAALPLLAACLLTEEPVVLRNVPRIRDVSDMRHLIEAWAWRWKTWATMPGGSPRGLFGRPTWIRGCAAASALPFCSRGR